MSMIASLRGKVIDTTLNSVVIEVGGVGYGVTVTPRTISELTKDEDVFLLTHMVVREDSMTLFGFLNRDEREMFKLLQSVSGLGPKLAMAALSVYSAGEIATALATSNQKTLTVIPGVGKKVADRMILELKDKVGVYAEAATETGGDAAAIVVPTLAVETVIEALQGLGFTAALAEKTVASLHKQMPEADSSELLRAALSSLGKR